MVYTSNGGTIDVNDWTTTTTYNPTTATTTTTTVSTTPHAITITPDMLTSSYSAYTPPSTTISLSMLGEKEIEEKIKKARDSVDKHVDELEQDLAYLNEQRQELEQTVFNMGDRIAAQEKLIDELQVKLDIAMDHIRILEEREQEYINNNILERILELEDKVYEMDKRDVGQD